MSIPTILDRAADTAGQHIAGHGNPWPSIPYDDLTITMESGLFRPRFFVTYPFRDWFGCSDGSVIAELRRHLVLEGTVKVRTPGTLREWLVYQGWLSGREYEALRNETH